MPMISKKKIIKIATDKNNYGKGCDCSCTCVEGGAISPKDNLMDFLIKRFWLADHLTDERVGDKQLSSTGHRLYAVPLRAWTG